MKPKRCRQSLKDKKIHNISGVDLKMFTEIISGNGQLAFDITKFTEVNLELDPNFLLVFCFKQSFEVSMILANPLNVVTLRLSSN